MPKRKSTAPAKATVSKTAKEPVATPTRRQAARRAAQKPPTKSPYFEQDSEEGDDAQEESEEDEFTTASQGSETAGDGSDQEIAALEEDEEDEAEEEESNTKSKRKRGSKEEGAPKARGKKMKLSKTEVFIPTRERTPGDTPYADERVHSNTMEFLGDLKKNNDRDWMREHDGEYRQSKKDWETFVEKLSVEISEKVDSTIPELPLKDLVFKLHRDVRFSNDKTPYKTHFSAAWSRTGKKGPYACYYLSIAPGGSHIGGGLWHPEAQPLSTIRRDIDRNAQRWKDVLTGESFASEFLGSKSKTPQIIKAFCYHNKGDALKTAPKGFPKDHRDIELLRLRSFTVGSTLSDEEVLSSDLVERVVEIYRKMEPLITHLNNVVMPDIGQDDDDDSD